MPILVPNTLYTSVKVKDNVKRRRVPITIRALLVFLDIFASFQSRSLQDSLLFMLTALKLWQQWAPGRRYERQVMDFRSSVNGRSYTTPKKKKMFFVCQDKVA